LDVLDAETVKQELDTLANQLCNWNEGCAMIAHRASDSDQIVVFFDAQDTRIGVNSVRLYGECMRKNGYSHAIICAVAGLTPFSEREMQEQQRIHKCRIEMFHYQDLQFCIGTHLLQGAHRLLTEEEKTKLLKKFSLDNEQKLDKIFVADPMARFYDMKPGQVIEFRVCNGSQEPFY
jgi:DNA-directed RNA polymerase I, II, and III subunit RPABC1